MKKVGKWLKIKAKKFYVIIIRVKLAFKRESKETVVAAKILIRLIKDDSKVSDEEVRFLKSQSADLGKAAALIGLQLVPGSSLGIVALEKVGKKRGFTIFPKEHVIPKNSLEDSSPQRPSSLQPLS